ncbi:carboxypeptidase regulatory-like domain-containing protein [Haliovirga abyssi]|uniref:Tetratricopeptide repeat protein n=1 Tax=Haliovirga abyssi TaxID=2996794 RepID=A0AAU9DEM2_9FUSO|nr:carboxypeptidase regulatory-like domain-containing protein [Haliovirga abyssi]BDU49792.1 hypothetical protein HLVA_03610 [Haliovirga abyssi]
MKKSIVIVLIGLLGLSGCIGVWGDKTTVKPKYEKTAVDYYEAARTNFADPYKVTTPEEVDKNVVENAKMAEGKSLLEKDSEIEMKSKLLRAMAQNYKGQLLVEEGEDSPTGAISRARAISINNSKAELEFAEANIELSALEYKSIAAKAIKVNVLSNWSQIDDTKLTAAEDAADNLSMVQDQIDSDPNLQNIKVAGEKIESEDVLTKVADIYIKKGDNKKAMESLAKAQEITDGKNKTTKDSKVLKIKIKMADVLIDSGQPEAAAKVLKSVVDESQSMSASTDIKEKAKAKLVAEGLQRVQAIAEAGVDLSDTGIDTEKVKKGLKNVTDVANAGTQNLITDEKLNSIKGKVADKINEAKDNVEVGKDKEINNAYSQLLIGELDKSEKLFETLIQDSEVLASGKYTRDVIFGLALVYTKKGETENAIETYKRVSVLIPEDGDSVKRAAMEISKLSEDKTEEVGGNKLVIIPPTFKKTSFLPGDSLSLAIDIMYSDMSNIDKNIELKASIYNKQGEEEKDIMRAINFKYDEKNVFKGEAVISLTAISGQYKLVIMAKEKNGALYSRFEMPIFIGRISDIKNNVKIDMVKIDKDILKVELMNFKTNSGIKLKINSTEAAISMAGEAIYSLTGSDKLDGEHEMNIELYQNNKVVDTRIFKYKIGTLEVISDESRAAIEVKVKDIVSRFNGDKANILSLVDDKSNLYRVLSDKLTTASAIDITREEINKPIVDKYGNFAIVRTNEKVTVNDNEIPYYQEYKLVKIVDEDGAESWKIRNIAFLDILFVNSKNIDTDNDGLTDEEEEQLGTNPNNPDTDGDGYTDGEEVAKNSDPNNKDSVPAEEEGVNATETVNILNQVFDILSNSEAKDTIEGFINGSTTESAISFINKYYTENIDETFKEELTNKIKENLEFLSNKKVTLKFIKPNVEEKKLNEIPFDLRKKSNIYILNLDVVFDLRDDSDRPIFTDNMHFEFVGKKSEDGSLSWKVRYASKLENGFFIPEILKSADNQDNDGDGYIDEELPNGEDDDGDGLVDEDLRAPIGGGVDDTGVVKFTLNNNHMKFVKIIAKYSVNSTDTTESAIILKGAIRRFGRIQTETTEDKLPLNTELKVKIDVEGVGKYESDWFTLTADSQEEDLGDITNKLMEPMKITFPENEHEFDLSTTNGGVRIEWTKLNSDEIKTYAVVVVTDMRDIEQGNFDNFVAVKFMDATTTESAMSWDYKESSMDDFDVNNGFGRKLLPNTNYIAVIGAFKEDISTLMQESNESDPVVISKPVMFKVKGIEGLYKVGGNIYNNNFIPFGVNIAVMENMPDNAEDVTPDYIFRIDSSNAAGWDNGERAFRLPFEISIPEGKYYIGAYLDVNNNGRIDEGDLLSNLLGEEDNDNNGEPDGFVVDKDKTATKLYLRENMGGDTIKGTITNKTDMAGNLMVAILEYNKESQEPHGNFVTDMIAGNINANDDNDYKMNFKPYGDGNIAFGIETFIDLNGDRMPEPNEPKSSFTKFYDNGGYIIDKEHIDLTINKIVTPGDGIDNDKDGKVDEELPNGIDDDGDGLIDEDTKIPENTAGDGEVIGKVELEGGYGSFIDYGVLIYNTKEDFYNFLFGGTTDGGGNYDITGLPVDLPENEKLMIEFKKEGYQQVTTEAGITKDMHTNTLQTIILKKRLKITKPNTQFVMWNIGDSNLDTEVMWELKSGVKYKIVVGWDYETAQSKPIFEKDLGSDIDTYTFTKEDLQNIGIGHRVILVIGAGAASAPIDVEIQDNTTYNNKIIGEIVTKEPINQNIILGLFENDPKNMNEFRPKYRFDIDRMNYTTTNSAISGEMSYIYSYNFTIPETGFYYIAAMVDNDANNMITPNDFVGMLNYAMQIKAGDNQISRFGLERMQGGDNLDITIDVDNSITVGNIMLGLYKWDSATGNWKEKPEEQSNEPFMYHQEFGRQYDLEYKDENGEVNRYALMAFVDVDGDGMPKNTEEVKSDYIELTFDNTGRIINRNIYLPIMKNKVTGTSKIDVTVIADDNSTITGANVEIYNEKYNLRIMMVTNASGEVVFEKLPAGKYDVKVRKEGYSEEYEEIYTVDGETTTKSFTMQQQLGETYFLRGTIMIEGATETLNMGRVVVNIINSDNTEEYVTDSSIMNNNFEIGNLVSGSYRLHVVDIAGYPEEVRDFVIDKSDIYIDDIVLKKLGEGSISGNVSARNFPWGEIRVNTLSGKEVGQAQIDPVTGSFVVDGLPIGTELKYEINVEGYMWYGNKVTIDETIKTVDFGTINLQEAGTNTLEVTITNPEVVTDFWHAGILKVDENGNKDYITNGEWNGVDKIYFRNIPTGNFVIEISGNGFMDVQDMPVEVINENTILNITLKTPIKIVSPATHSIEKDGSGNYTVNFQWEDNTAAVNTYVIAVKQGEINNDNITGPEYFDTALILVDKTTKEWTYVDKAKATGSLEFANSLTPNYMYGYMILGFAETTTELEAKINNSEDVEPIITSEPDSFMLASDAVGEVEVKVINTNNVPIPSDGSILVAIFKDYMPMGEDGGPTGDQIVGIKENVPVSTSLLPGNAGGMPGQTITVPISQEMVSTGATTGYVAFVMVQDGMGNEIKDLFGADLVKFNSTGLVEPIDINMIGGASDEVMGMFAKKIVTLNLTLPTDMNIDYSKNVKMEADIYSEDKHDGIAWKEFKVNSDSELPTTITLYIMKDYDINNNYKIHTSIYYDNGAGNKENIAGDYDVVFDDGDSYNMDLQLDNGNQQPSGKDITLIGNITNNVNQGAIVMDILKTDEQGNPLLDGNNDPLPPVYHRDNVSEGALNEVANLENGSYKAVFILDLGPQGPSPEDIKEFRDFNVTDITTDISLGDIEFNATQPTGKDVTLTGTITNNVTQGAIVMDILKTDEQGNPLLDGNNNPLPPVYHRDNVSEGALNEVANLENGSYKAVFILDLGAQGPSPEDVKEFRDFNITDTTTDISLGDIEFNATQPTGKDVTLTGTITNNVTQGAIVMDILKTDEQGNPLLDGNNDPLPPVYHRDNVSEGALNEVANLENGSYKAVFILDLGPQGPSPEDVKEFRDFNVTDTTTEIPLAEVKFVINVILTGTNSTGGGELFILVNGQKLVSNLPAERVGNELKVEYNLPIGTYKAEAFIDTNGNGQYDSGERKVEIQTFDITKDNYYTTQQYNTDIF